MSGAALRAASRHAGHLSLWAELFPQAGAVPDGIGCRRRHSRGPPVHGASRASALDEISRGDKRTPERMRALAERRPRDSLSAELATVAATSPSARTPAPSTWIRHAWSSPCGAPPCPRCALTAMPPPSPPSNDSAPPTPMPRSSSAAPSPTPSPTWQTRPPCADSRLSRRRITRSHVPAHAGRAGRAPHCRVRRR